MQRAPIALLGLSATLCFGCHGEDGPAGLQLKLSNAAVQTKTASAALSVADSAGVPLELRPDNTDVVVEVRSFDGDWELAQDVDVDYQGPSRLDVVVVADNSGSQLEHLSELRESVQGFSQHVLNGSQRDRVGLVRVSTVASVLQELTEDAGAVDAATDGFFVTNGWTALWDGVRLANEVLERGAVVPTPRGNRPRVCVDRAYTAIVAFTDGKENNSGDEHPTRYAGDGVDTELGNLLELVVHGTRTPVHTVGVGHRIDEESLSELSDRTGGLFVPIEHMGQLYGALVSTAARLRSQVPICFERPDCGYTEARITVSVDHEGDLLVAEFPLDLPADACSDN